jgi:endonuclease/exonuclease/phosphatase family metal-dependent hydrolase
MKLITLNLWGGIVYEPLINFIKKHSEDTDIFCFQEMLFGDNPKHTLVHKARENLFNEIKQQLPEFIAYKYISPSEHFQDEQIEFKAGQAIFIRNSIKVKNNDSFRCYDKPPFGTESGGKLTGSLQWIDLEVNNEIITIASLHGLWQKGTSKADTVERLIQSQKIKDFLDTKNNKKIICGDFNLTLNGKSIEILEYRMINLIKKYNIQSTRSSFYKKDDKFADYIIISDDITKKDFKVFQDDVSDHLPVLLEFK